MTKGGQWQNRIVGEGEEAPDQLLANPDNWRIHPKVQQEVLQATLNEVGWVQRVIVNKRTGHLIDGHLRVQLAMRKGEATIPVLYVDLEQDEEYLVLASLDPIGAMAIADQAKYHELLVDCQARQDELAAWLAQQHDAEAEGNLETIDLDALPGHMIWVAFPFPVEQAESVNIILAQLRELGLQVETSAVS